jgi:osmoprotectant transport system ATP-binding protein
MSLEVAEVRKAYAGVDALAGVSLVVAPGECLALVGESGSGKTTLLRLFNRMTEPDAGRVLVDGKDVARVDPVRLRRRMGYVQQSGGLLPHWSVLRNVALVPWLEGHSDAEAAARAALELVGLDPSTYGSRPPSELSGGQRQRVAIARALAAEPEHLLLDEPFSALDAITRADVHAAFLEVRRRLRITTLLVTHDLREAGALADRIAVLRRGRIEQVGAPADLFERPATPYVAELVQRAGVAA